MKVQLSGHGAAEIIQLGFDAVVMRSRIQGNFPL
jgi:hypothetical protein